MPNSIRLALIAGAMVLLPGAASAQTAEHIGSYTWAAPTEDFGGFSGIEVSEDGSRFTAVGDQGTIVAGQFEREGMLISGVTAAIHDLKNTNGSELSKSRSDAEGLAIRADGQIFISFERFHRVWTYHDTESRAVWIPQHPDFEDLKKNSALETLAIGPDGALYTMPERAGEKPNPVYRYKSGTWDVPFHIQHFEEFKAVGADFGPDGKLYLLERALRHISGFQTRVRRFDLHGDVLGEGELVLETTAGTHDNLEGLSVWRDDAGDIRLTMISDDNFNIIQRTEFVEYRLQE